MRKIENVIGFVTRKFSYVSLAALTFMMVIIIVDVALRKATGSGIKGSPELVGLAESIAVFFAFGYTQHKRGLVHVSFFMKKFPKMGPLICWTITGWISTITCGLIAYASFVQAAYLTGKKTATATLFIPYYPFYYLMAIGFCIFTLALLFDSIKNVVAFFNEDVRKDVEDNWPA